MTMNTKIARQESKYYRNGFRYSHETAENTPLESFSCGDHESPCPRKKQDTKGQLFSFALRYLQPINQF